MPARHSRQFALTGPLGEWVDDRIAKGEYTSLSDLILTAIRVLRSQENAQAHPVGPSCLTPPPPPGRS